jgi:hypothetical protein
VYALCPWVKVPLWRPTAAYRVLLLKQVNGDASIVQVTPGPLAGPLM